MSGALSIAVRRLLDSQGSAKKAGPRSDAAYGQALEAFWQKNYKSALNILTERLATEPTCAAFAHLYRLWIEVCAESGDRASLRVLKKHLFQMGQEQTSEHGIFFALRALVHFELDEFEAASVAAKALGDGEHNPYALEFLQRMGLRRRQVGPAKGQEDVKICSLLRAKAPLSDYCHWHYLVQGLLIVQDDEALGLVLEHVGRLYQKSHLPHLFEYHRCVERGYFAAAATVAERLREISPDSIDYMYYQAYAYFEDGDYPSARKVLHEANRITAGLDAEIVGLLGHCHAKLGGAAEAAECLNKAMQLLTKEGLPTSQVAMEYLDVQGELEVQGKADMAAIPREPQGWIVELSARRVHELVNSPDNVTERLLRPMGTRALPGDLCFLTSNSQTRDSWNIIAVYAVESEPMWHPTHGHQSVLKRVTTFPQGIPLDVTRMPAETEAFFVDQEHDSSLRDVWGDVTRLAKLFGVSAQTTQHAFHRSEGLGHSYYQLDADALMVVEEVISKHRDDMVDRRKSLQSRRPTA